MKKSTDVNQDKWWYKPPRSSKQCLYCGHKFASHIENLCLKVISRKPRIECVCKGFISTDEELEKMKSRL